MARELPQSDDGRRYQAVDNVGPDGEQIAIYDRNKPAAWVQSDLYVEVRSDG